jgi:hypothetical protein
VKGHDLESRERARALAAPPWLHTAFATEAEALNFSRAKVLQSPHRALVSTAEVKLLLQENLTLAGGFHY